MGNKYMLVYYVQQGVSDFTFFSSIASELFYYMRFHLYKMLIKNFQSHMFLYLGTFAIFGSKFQKKYYKNHCTYRFHSVFSELFDYMRCEQQKTLIKKFWSDMILYLGTFAIFGSIYPKKYISRTVAPTDLIFPLQNFSTICGLFHR